MTFPRKIQGVDSGRFFVPEALALPFCGSNDKYTDAAIISDSLMMVKLRQPAASVFQSPFSCRVVDDRTVYPEVFSGDIVVIGAAWNGDSIFGRVARYNDLVSSLTQPGAAPSIFSSGMNSGRRSGVQGEGLFASTAFTGSFSLLPRACVRKRTVPGEDFF